MQHQRRLTIPFPTLSLSFIKAVKTAANVTINDVLLSVTAGAIRRYCLLMGDPLFSAEDANKADNDADKSNATNSSSSNSTKKEEVRVRALIPVAFPRPMVDTASPANSLRNLWSFVSAPLPINPPTPLARLKLCNQDLTRLKQSPLAYIQLWMQNNVLCGLPDSMQQQAAMDVFSRHTLVFSNMPGPQEPLIFCQQQLLGLHIVFPNLLPQIIILSYAGGIFGNINLNPDMFPASKEENIEEMLPKLFMQELQELANSLEVDTSHMLHKENHW